MTNHSELIKNLTNDFLNESKRNLLFCEGIKDGFYETIPKINKNNSNQFFELPCSENASVGMALGASTYGLNSILCFQRVEFALLALEQIANNSSKISYLTDQKRKNPALFRFVIGRGWGQGPSHSQSFETMFAQIPNINVVMPVFPEDTKLIFESFRSLESPTISLEHRWVLFNEFSHVTPKKLSPYVLKEGKHLTIVATSYEVIQSLILAKIFEKFGVLIEVINFYTISTLNYGEIFNSIRKTNHLITIDTNSTFYGASSELLSQICCSDFFLKKPPIRLGSKSHFSPSSRHLIDDYYLSLKDISNAIFQLINIQDELRLKILHQIDLINKKKPNDVPNIGFSGPF